MNNNYTIGEIVEVKIEKIVPRGFGLGFVEKLTVLTPMSVLGDVLSVRIVAMKKRMAWAEIVEIKVRGEQRIDPPCEYFGKCGGCDFQQMTYPAQLTAKIGIIRDCLHRIGKIDYEDNIEMIGSPKEFGYRSRARWHIDRKSRKLGYFRRDSHDVIDISSCPILTPELQSTLESTRQSLDWETLWGDEAQIEAATVEDERVSLYSLDITEPTAELTIRLNGDTYIFSAQTFFQANRNVIEDLIEAAIGGATGTTAFDLYSGVGLFALPLARKFSRVVAVEEHPVSFEFATKNIENARLTNVELVESSVGRYLNRTPDRDIDFVLIDPPRSGTEKQTIPAIAKLNPAAISYVSCEPSILARDLGLLLEAGYRIDKITAIDLFPQTHHIETVVRLSRMR